ncbi:putative RNA methyltransferase [Paenarthrobacter sp. PH39-S1]|uniref:putative RNA methyltransferase n=1 Tax=Paenarthrobacter sp. PH39-S1 TaxID=3046204 RepID=UPI0024BB0110|nr:methyltransferase domain-containing protein [Paenarthrobacter sp. PH39-S1]MDJ0356790.1 SAM-dependent methyltransferase [Paenarthrobacter sp. PH39-S1]
MTGPADAEPSAKPVERATALVCDSGHSFDIARQGYVNLLTGPGTRFIPDTSEMVAARDGFLTAGHYLPLAEQLADTVLDGLENDQLVVDAGTGTGYYLRQLHRAADNTTVAVSSIGLDISKYALRRAARANPDTVNLVWDVWQPLPIAAATAAAVVVVFAPRNPAEFARILQPDGKLVVVTPLPGHLAEIAEVTGMLGIQGDKQIGLQASLSGFFSAGAASDLEYTLELTRDDVARAALMGPAGHHLVPAQLQDRVAALDERTVATVRFQISTFLPVRLPFQTPAIQSAS